MDMDSPITDDPNHGSGAMPEHAAPYRFQAHHHAQTDSDAALHAHRQFIATQTLFQSTAGARRKERKHFETPEGFIDPDAVDVIASHRGLADLFVLVRLPDLITPETPTSSETRDSLPLLSVIAAPILPTEKGLSTLLHRPPFHVPVHAYPSAVKLPTMHIGEFMVPTYQVSPPVGDLTPVSPAMATPLNADYGIAMPRSTPADESLKEPVRFDIDIDNEIELTDTRAPTFTSPTSDMAIEDQNVLYTAVAVDPDIGPGPSNPVTYAISGTDAALLAIDSVTGVVTLASGNLDYETKNSYTFTVEASDAVGNIRSQTVSISIDNIDEVAPTFTSATAGSTNENQNSIYTTTTVDTDWVSGSTNYSLLGGLGDDAGLLGIDAATGVVTLASGNLDYETKNSYAFTVQATDAAGHSSTQTVTVTVNNLDEVAPSITSATTGNALENQNVMYTAVASDPALDGGPSNPLTYSLSGTDASLLHIDSVTGTVTLASGNLDYETKNSYAFTIEATDTAGNQAQQNIVVSLTNLDEVAPNITSATTGTATENQNVLYTAVASDPALDGGPSNPLTYSLSGTDASLLHIDSATGVVTLASGNLDYETKNSYTFTVVATDAVGNHSQQTVTITVTNLDEVAPTFTSVTTSSANENQNMLYTAASTDSVDYVSGTTSYSFGTTGGSDGDATALLINPSTGVVTLASGNLDYETKNSYTFTVVATDAAGNHSQQEVTISVTNLDEISPDITSGSSDTVQENQTLLYNTTASDPALDGGPSNPITYGISGTDAGLLNINTATGVVTLASGSLDYETKSTYDFVVQASDAASNVSTQVVTITVNAPPALTAGPIISRNGITFTVADPDSGDTLDYLSPFAGIATINNGSTSTIANTAQLTAITGDVSVTDHEGHTLALGLYLSIGTDDANTLSCNGANVGVLYGFGGGDTLTGTDLSNNYIFGGSGDDTLNGGQLDNVLEGGAGTDQIYGGEGNNTYVYNAETVNLDEIVYFHDDPGTTETLRIDSYSDMRGLNGGGALDGLDAIQFTNAGTGTQASFSHFQISGLTMTVTGNSSAQLLEVSGTGGLDVIDLSGIAVSNAQLIVFGGAGRDTITGTSANDIISGGLAADTLSGGGGNDVFRHVTGNSTGVTFVDVVPTGNTAQSPGTNDTFSNVDIITDINVGDAIEFGNTAITGNVTGTLLQDTYMLVQGSYTAGTFTTDASTADTLLLFDGSSATGVQAEYVMLVGVNAAEAAAALFNSGTHTLTF